LLCPYCISGSYRRVAPVLPLFLVPLVPVARGAKLEGRSGAKLGGPAKRGRAAKGTAAVLSTRCTLQSSLSRVEYLLPRMVALHVQSHERSTSAAGVQSKVMPQQPQCFFPMPVALQVISLEQEKETASRRFSIGAFCAPRQTLSTGPVLHPESGNKRLSGRA
jgi:hypothetical protein